ncbi:fungal-specific transcription factor domain-containing protein [Rhexocercosporidium sp. MPI-PUGE-AT-0058]|nr:fungal-specific transcription factor domain-containing protein [Rhexocercosporidium sp. MPI-PUGE-AT-0058]
MKSYTGCWTCRLRRKKCDEKQPICGICSTLLIGHACYYNNEKPVWMDGGVRQEEISRQVKKAIKENAFRRRGGFVPGDGGVVDGGVMAGEGVQMVSPAELARDMRELRCSIPESSPDLVIQDQGTGKSHSDTSTSPTTRQRGPSCILARKDHPQSTSTGTPIDRSSTMLFTFYLSHVHPFLFPFYNPSPLLGGRSWILEMMLSSPVHQKTYLYQSSYFFTLAQENDQAQKEGQEARTSEVGVMPKKSNWLAQPTETDVHGAVRVLASIMQVQRFDIAVSGFGNCRAHLNGASALFKHLLDSQSQSLDQNQRHSPSETEVTSTISKYTAILNHLGPPSDTSSLHCTQIPSSEQAAFSFSTGLLIVDDIIASTSSKEVPKLYAYHAGLLNSINNQPPLIDLEAIIGCQNWVMLQIGEIAMLDAWKQQRKREGCLDVMELVYRATVIKKELETYFAGLEDSPRLPEKGEERNEFLDVLTARLGGEQKETGLNSQRRLATRIWTHAALIYLSVVVSGWQPANIEVRHHVNGIIELLTTQLLPPSLVRTMVWPFSVAGCLAEQGQESHFRGLVHGLKPLSVFGTMRKAMEIMEVVWTDRDCDGEGFGDCDRDLRTCFERGEDLVLLV